MSLQHAANVSIHFSLRSFSLDQASRTLCSASNMFMFNFGTTDQRLHIWQCNFSEALTIPAESSASLASTEGRRFRFGLEVVSVNVSESLMLCTYDITLSISYNTPMPTRVSDRRRISPSWVDKCGLNEECKRSTAQESCADLQLGANDG